LPTSSAARFEDLAEASPHRELFYGRRRGRPLRAGQRERQSTLLPQLSFAVPEGAELEPSSLFFERPRGIWLEIGFGGGEHLAAQAERHPDIGFLGCEVFENGVAKLLGEIDRRGLTNVRIYPNDARRLLAALPPRSVGRTFILFPDPWPKARHHKRRLLQPATVALIADRLRFGGVLHAATDHPGYAEQIAEVGDAEPRLARVAPGRSELAISVVRPSTKYEDKAQHAGSAVTELVWERR
jgi:tRNA (guanine-N7-)-methyltransferase